VGTAGALLSQVETLVEKDRIVRAGILAQLAADAFFRFDENKPVVTLGDGICGARFDAGRVIAMVAQPGDVCHDYFGHLTAHLFIDPNPELAGVRLGFGVGCPVVADMFIFTGDLAAVAAIAY
jgi:hypothetical protein